VEILLIIERDSANQRKTVAMKNQFRRTEGSVSETFVDKKLFRYKKTEDQEVFQNKYHRLIVDNRRVNGFRIGSMFLLEGHIVEAGIIMSDFEVEFHKQNLFFS
jgi:hypothetical protein